MRRRVVGLILIASVVGGVVAGIAAHGLTRKTDPGPTSTSRSAGPASTSSTPSARVDDVVEVRDPVLVLNDDETATLSATVVNHTDRALVINDAVGGIPGSYAPTLLGYSGTPRAILQPEVPTTVGQINDTFRFRFRDRVEVGSVLPITLDLVKARYRRPASDVTFKAPVVARSAAYAGVANNGPNSAITVKDAVIVVVPGQEKAYIGGYFQSTITDRTDIRATAESPTGQRVEILHQTATGGPSGYFAEAGTSLLGRPPYLDDGIPGDRDYVRVGEVTVGQTITMTFRFPSGDVVGRFRVVQGNPDGTI
jgi:hypothetical protein